MGLFDDANIMEMPHQKMMQSMIEKYHRDRERAVAQCLLKCLEYGRDFVVVSYRDTSPLMRQEYEMPVLGFEFDVGESVLVCRECDIADHIGPRTRFGIIRPNSFTAHQKLQLHADIQRTLENPDALHP